MVWRSFLGMYIGAITFVELESAIVFGDGWWCDRTCGIGECDRIRRIRECDRLNSSF